jgi:hypothetical protein
MGNSKFRTGYHAEIERLTELPAGPMSLTKLEECVLSE